MEQDIEEVIDIEGDFELNLGVSGSGSEVYDINELPSKSVNLQPEYMHHPWVLEQGWSLDPCMDEKSKATIEKMLLEEQQFINGRTCSKIPLSPTKATNGSSSSSSGLPPTHKQPWDEEERQMFSKGLEIFGRRWAKIAELIPTRTTLQVKNYGQQYFKIQKKQNLEEKAKVSKDAKTTKMNFISLTSGSTSSVLDVVKKEHPPEAFDSVEKILDALSTGKPTVLSAVKKEPDTIVKKGKMSKNSKLNTMKPALSKEKQKGDKSIKSNEKFIESKVKFGNQDSSYKVAKKKSSNKIDFVQQKVQNGNSSQKNELFCFSSKSGEILCHEDISDHPLFDEDEFIKESVVLIDTTNKELDTLECSAVQQSEEICAEHFNNDDNALRVTDELDVNTSFYTEDEDYITIGIHNKPVSSDNDCSTNKLEDDVTDQNIETGSTNDEDSEEIEIDIEGDLENEFQSHCQSTADEIYKKLVQEADISADIVCEEEFDEDDETYQDDNMSNACDTLFRKSKMFADSDNVDNSRTLGEQCQKVSVSLENIDSALIKSTLSNENDSNLPDKDSDSQTSESSSMSNCLISPEYGVLNSAGLFIPMPAPIKATECENGIITEEEKNIHFEFFDGRSLKTPERYLKIRSFILDSWIKSKPMYLYKTTVRAGLKNCGDVNCIGRIHSYLEQKGAINFGCEQASYCRVPKTIPSSSRIDKIHRTVSFLQTEGQKIIAPRKRRVKDSFGQWIPEEELEGRTIDEQNDVLNYKQPKLQNSRNNKTKSKQSYDPFQLIPCHSFSDELPAPFQVLISSPTLVIMDVHSHLSKTEVIGLLGGTFDNNVLEIVTAEPCNSISTGMQCEMDPVSQTQASEVIRQCGMKVVGWYHSHPTFHPNPSIRDIETQEKFQSWFGLGGMQFVGVIVNPYKQRSHFPSHVTPSLSDIRCLTVKQDVENSTSYRIPYQFNYSLQPNTMSEEITQKLEDLIMTSANYTNRVNIFMKCPGTEFDIITKIERSVRNHLRNDSEDFQTAVLSTMERCFMKYWKQVLEL